MKTEQEKRDSWFDKMIGKRFPGITNQSYNQENKSEESLQFDFEFQQNRKRNKNNKTNNNKSKQKQNQEIHNPKEKKQFRLRGKKMFLTYSNVKKQYKKFKLKPIFEKHLSVSSDIELVKNIIENIILLEDGFLQFPLTEKELHFYKMYKKHKKENPSYDATFYSDYPFDLSNLSSNKEIILEKIKQKLKAEKIKEYVIAQEKHNNGDLHFHLYLEFYHRQELFGKDCLDLIFNKFFIHGGYETVRKKESAINYITKTGDFIAEPLLMYYEGILYSKFKDFLTAIYTKEGLIGVESYIADNPTSAAKGGTLFYDQLVKSDRIKYKNKSEKHVNKQIIPIECFNIPLVIKNWYENDCVESLVISGPSGIGKTEFSKSLLKFLNKCFLMIRNKHGLEAYKPEYHKAILFDDMSYEEEQLTREQLIGFGDTTNPSDIRIIRNSIHIMPDTIRIFTSNKIKDMIQPVVRYKEVLSRYLIVHLNGSLFKEGTVLDKSFRIRSLNRQKQIIDHNKAVLELLDEGRDKEITPELGSNFKKSKSSSKTLNKSPSWNEEDLKWLKEYEEQKNKP